MISDARTLDEGTELTADVCIVGSGPAGMTLALSLRDAGLSVLVLEGGGLTPEEAYQDLMKGSNRGIDEMRLDRQRVRALGGSSHHWAGFCRPLGPEDFEERPWIANSGWPIDYADVLPYYRRAQRWLELGGFEYGADLAERMGLGVLDSPESGIASTLFQFSGPTRFATRYQADLEEVAGLTVMLHANVTDLRLEAPALDRLDHLVVQVLEGPRFTVRAERFVLAAGGIETTRLLLASDSQRPEGVANGGGLVGRYYMDHPHHYLDLSWIHPEALDARFYRLQRATVPDAEEALRVRVQGTLRLPADLRAELGVLDFSVTIRSAEADELELGSLDETRLATLLAPRHDGWAMEKMTVRSEQAPRFEQRIELNGDRDALGMRRVDVHWTIDDEDSRQLARGLTRLASELGAGRHGRMRIPTDDRGRLDVEVEPAPHHMGTTRMAASAERGVVDADGRTFEVENLYIAGSGVFCTGGSANPTLTIVALAERLADHLRGLPYEREEP